MPRLAMADRWRIDINHDSDGDGILRLTARSMLAGQVKNRPIDSDSCRSRAESGSRDFPFEINSEDF